MKKFCIFLFLFIVFINNIKAGESVYLNDLPTPIGPNHLEEKMVWNRWTTKNFTILSISDSQGEFLHRNIENIKAWSLDRWGLPNVDFTKECRIFCAPDRATMLKLFNVEEPYAEIQQEITYLWLVLDGKPAEVIPSALTIISLHEYELRMKRKFNWWAIRGMANLNLTYSQIKSKILSSNTSTFSSKRMFNMTQEEWQKMPNNEKVAFDLQALGLCLLIRKEYGQNNFLCIATSDGSEQQVGYFLGFNDLGNVYNEFDSIYNRYIGYLIIDVKSGKTPNNYIQIVRAN